MLLQYSGFQFVTQYHSYCFPKTGKQDNSIRWIMPEQEAYGADMRVVSPEKVIPYALRKSLVVIVNALAILLRTHTD